MPPKLVPFFLNQITFAFKQGSNRYFMTSSPKDFSTISFLFIQPEDVSKFSDTTPTDPDIKKYENDNQNLQEKVKDFKDPGHLSELAEKVEDAVSSSRNKDEAIEKISDIRKETISNGNKFNEEIREDNQHLIDQAHVLHRQNKMDEQYLSEFSREQEEWISYNLNINNQHIVKELELIDETGEQQVRIQFDEFVMSSCGEYSSSDDNKDENKEVHENKGEGTSEVEQAKSDTSNAADLASSKSVPKASENKPSLIDDYADPNTEPFDPMDPDA